MSGNKWWKLKYNLVEATEKGFRSLLTFGGAYSNHIYAVAAAAHELGLESIGVIRGEQVLPLNPTLHFASAKGMALHYISRDAYRRKADTDFLDGLGKRFGNCYVIPEGGSNNLAVDGVAEFAKTLDELTFDYLCCPVGTGGTIAGLIKGISREKEVLGFSSLKGGAYLRDEVLKFGTPHSHWEINDAYHFGGYAKTTPALLSFISRFEESHHIPLDFVYTGKMMYGIFDLIAKGFFKRGSTLLALHTGGVRGREK